MGIIIATLIVVVAIAAALAQDFAIFSWAYWQEESGGSTSRSEVFRNNGLFLAAVIALVFAFWRAKIATKQAEAAAERANAAIDQVRIAEQGHITERFSRAVEQLGHDRVAVRIGGLYALKRIAEDSVERDHLAVMDVLTNFIRQPPYADAQREAADQEKPELIDCPDIIAAIEIIQGRSEAQKAVEKKRKYRLSVSRASLSYLQLLEIDLEDLDLAGAYLRGADLKGANLKTANLKGANLKGANLKTANLADANLKGANLMGANLTVAFLWDARLADANLTNANLTGAHLERAHLERANLTDANLGGAKLLGADLERARLTGAILWLANLMGANLADARLTDANLTDANLTGAKNLTRKQLKSACIRKGDKPPTLPPKLKQPEPWKRCPEPTAE